MIITFFHPNYNLDRKALNIKLLKLLNVIWGGGGGAKIAIENKYCQKRYSIYPIKILLNYISLRIICKEAPPHTELGEIKDSRENVLCFYFSIFPAVPGKFQGLVLH